MNKVWVLVRKEWSEVFKNRFVLFAVAFMPLLFTAIPLVTLYSMRTSGDLSDTIGMSDMPAQFAQMCGEGLSGGECGQYFLLVQFLILFMMMPVIIPVTIASYSIVGEKRTHTLEPLLATPITTIELLSGKALAAVLPAMAATWGSFALFGIGAALMTGPAVVGKLLAPLWLLAIFMVGPLLSVAAVSIAVMVSSRVNDPRVAEQLSALVVLPLVGLLLSQAFGLIFIDQTVILWMAIILVVIDAGLLALATQLFQRETILTRWK